MAIRRLVVVLAVFAGVCVVPVTVLTDSTARGTTTVASVADAYVSARYPDTNFGATAWVTADGSPLRFGYYRFDVTVPAGEVVTSAVFRCWAGSSNGTGAVVTTAANDWSEDTVTWADAPPPDFTNQSVADTGPVTEHTYATADVTAMVPGTGTYTFVMSTASRIAWSCASQENTGGHPPALVITTAGAPGPTPTPSESSSPTDSPTPTPSESGSSTDTSTPTPTPSGSGSSTDTSTPTPTPTTTTVTTPPPSTSSPPPVSTDHKVLVILLENHSAAEALTQMPHLATWGATFGQATDYFAVSHPSLPNYLAIWGGSTFGITSDCSVGSSGCVPAAPSVWGQTLAAGKTAQAYQESMTSNCQTSGSGGYAPRHGPWPYWVDTTERAGCQANDVPSGTTSSGPLLDDVRGGTLPVTGELTPNLCNDAHDCSLGTADAWLAGWMPILMAGPDYLSGHLTIIVTFDEDDGSQSNHVPFVVIDPQLKTALVTARVDHYSLTRWLDDNAGVTRLRNAASAFDLRAAFGL
ncbi:MAG: phosphatidylinositol-3-phosphatase [Pseudonocardiales bacterium]|nr:phosphatidylinositol-3-phosphatase [Pseudonocardiales bacterium]